MYTSWITVGVLVILGEGLLWILFEKKLRGLHFRHSTDELFFRFFSPSRLRLVAILHTVFLLTVFILISLFLW